MNWRVWVHNMTLHSIVNPWASSIVRWTISQTGITRISNPTLHSKWTTRTHHWVTGSSGLNFQISFSSKDRSKLRSTSALYISKTLVLYSISCSKIKIWWETRDKWYLLESESQDNASLYKLLLISLKMRTRLNRDDKSWKVTTVSLTMYLTCT